ncbi:hypothetical protein Tsubulata_048337 [Turnera subulata]|uniref:Berberine/berberine-like domain-containing protein n=1 Tax=Turnera subulata TaxID=218843 RepID=A0A9Q0JE44_9ROSI|nr:hypothetical protein Tsubulata_048337 [Turnera subulata]
MSWVESTVYFAEFPSNTSVDALLNRTPPNSIQNSKGKSDFVREPIPESGLEGIWKILMEQVEGGNAVLLLHPFGGIMNEISESSIPFPHRAGNIYHFHPLLNWDENGREASEKYLNWIRRLHAYLTPYVSKNPRAAYANYRDLDLGANTPGQEVSYRKARVWGIKYFKNNFDRLVKVKTSVDPHNFFRNEQSIPPFSA